MSVPRRVESQTKLEMSAALLGEGISLHDREPIGAGSFSTVCVGSSSRFGVEVAVKIIDVRIKSEYIRRFLPRELELLPGLMHPNIVRVYQVVRTAAYVAIVQEYAVNGDLLTLIESKQKLDESEARFLFRQLVEAIKYLAQKHIVHRDIKCENIFLDGNHNVKLGDFGFSRVLVPPEDTDTQCGSRGYAAPELQKGERYSGNASDIWSASVVLFAMLTGRMPFDERHAKEMLEKQLKHITEFPSDIPVAEDARVLICRMLHPNKALRATIGEIEDSNWLKGTSYHIRTERPDSLSRRDSQTEGSTN